MSDAKALGRLIGHARGGVVLEIAANGAKLLARNADGGTIAIGRDVVDEAMRRGLVKRKGRGIVATPEGRAFRTRLGAAAGAMADQHRDLMRMSIEDEGTRHEVTVDANESPLTQLARRRTADGARFISPGELCAGERLRADYDYGRIMPRLGANWQASVASGRRDAANAHEEMTASTLAARQRVERALAAVGPELSGILIDVCCFLKGLEQVEMERRWPRRSAKLMLKTGLAGLERHYEPVRAQPRGAGGIVHWGSEDYRPRVSAG